MSHDREKLLSRFRAVLTTRVKAGEQALSSLDVAEASEVLRRELHTLKGESRMLGLSHLSALAHALEERVVPLASSDPEIAESARETLRTALHRVGLVLAAEGTAEESEAWLSEVLSGLSAPDDMPKATPASEPAAVPIGSAERAAARRERWCQVDAHLIDRMCERLSELASELADMRSSGRRGPSDKHERLALEERWDRVRRTMEECTRTAWELRLVPVSPTLEELARHAMNLASSLGKTARVEVTAHGVEFETDVLEQMWDPLLHLAQNAVDHGLEPPDQRGQKSPVGLITLRAESSGPNVVFTVEDDGRGIDVEAVRRAAAERGEATSARPAGVDEANLLDLVFEPGFSTRPTPGVLSGRGVGLHVVRSKVQALGGDITLETRPGRGARFTLTVPFAVTRERVLVVGCGESSYGIPARCVRAVIRVPKDGVDTSQHCFIHDGQSFPRRSLSRLLGVQGEPEEELAVLVQLSKRTWALTVPSLFGEEEVIRSPVDALLAASSLFGATARTARGDLFLILRLDRLAYLLRSDAPVDQPRLMPRTRRTVLVVDDSRVVCDVVTEILTEQGLNVLVANDVSRALAAFEEHAVDLVVSDVEMPGRDGFALLEEIRRRARDVPVIMLTTRGSVDDRQRAAKLGANAYIVKSDFQGGALLDTVRRYTEFG